MTKSDLRSGMSIETRNNLKFLVITDVDTVNYGKQEVAFVTSYNFRVGSNYKEDLLHSEHKDNDIMAVYGPIVNRDTYDMEGPLIWKREEEKVEMTIEELEKKLGYNSGTLRIKK